MTSRKRHQTKPRLDLNTRRTNPNIDQWTPHPFIQLLRSQRYTLTDRMLPTNDPFIPFVADQIGSSSTHKSRSEYLTPLRYSAFTEAGRRK